MVNYRLPSVLLIAGICSMLMLDQKAAGAQTAIQAPDGKGTKVTLVSIPGLSFLELDPTLSKQASAQAGALPHIEELKPRSAWGALNIRTPGKGLEDVYLSMGSGQVAEAGSAVTGIQSVERIGAERAGERYQRMTGAAAGTSGIVISSMEAIKRMNTSNDYHARPGLLGETLAAAGVQVSVWGNLDLVKADGGMKEAELGKTYRRYAPMMLMNEAGKVPQGDVSGSGLLIDGSRPYGLRTNYSWLMERWREQSNPSLTLLELGDLQRLYDERDNYSKEAFEQTKKEIMQEIDLFIGELARAMDKEAESGGAGQLWLLSPQVNAEAAKEKALMAPVMLYTPSGKEGRLTSATTRRPGLISFVDMAPALLRAFGLEVPPEMIGLPVVREATTDAFPKLVKDLQHIQAVYAQRPPLLYGLAVYEIVVMLAALAVVWFFVPKNKHSGKRAIGARGIALWRTLLFSLLLAPLGLLVMGWISSLAEGMAAAAVMGGVLAGSIAFASIAARVRKGFVYAMAAIGLLVAGFILYDGYHGAAAMQRSVLGYDPMIGARYYGIGNEFMGVLLGAALLGLTALQQGLRLARRRPRRAVNEPQGSFTASGAKPLLPVGFAAWRLPPLGALTLWPRVSGYGASERSLGGAAAPAAPGTPLRAAAGSAAARAWAALPAAAAGVLVAGYLAAPALGTNAGGALAAAAGFGALTARLAGGRRWLRLAPVLALLLAAALVGIWLLNSEAATGLPADKQSHIGRAFDLLLQGRLDIIGAIIVRKLEMNWHLIGVSAWSKVLLTGLAVMAALVLRPRGLFRRWQRRYPYLMYGCAANVIGTIAALLLNDSGIVAAATMIIYGSVPLLLLKLESA